MKKIIGVILALMLVLASMAPAFALTLPQIGSPVGPDSQTGTDIVVLIDRSGSMLNTDPSKIALEATKALMDIGVNEDPNLGERVSIAVIAYDYETNRTSNGFVNISDDNLRDSLKEDVQGWGVESKNEDTNTGLALQKAYEMIADRRNAYPEHTFAVVLLSDGEVLLKDSDGFARDFRANGNGMSKEDYSAQATRGSITLGDNVAQLMANEGIVLHCVGIYSDRQNRLGTDMERWALSTGGAYKTAKDIEEVPGLMNEIYGLITKQSIETIRFVDGKAEFDIPTGIVQVNLQIRPKINRTQNCSITYDSADGSRRGLPFTNLSFNSGSTYTVINMPRPEAGHYTIDLGNGADFECSLTLFTIQDLRLEIIPEELLKCGTQRIEVSVTKDGMPYHDSIDPRITIRDKDGSELVSGATMNYDSGTNLYYYDYNFTQPGKYTIAAMKEKDGMINVAEDIGIIVNRDLSPIAFTGHAVVKYDANGQESAGYTAPVELSYNDLVGNYFSNAPGTNPVKIEAIESDLDNAVDVYNDEPNGVIRITPVGGTNTPAELEVRAHYADGYAESLNTQITVEDLQAPVRLSQEGQLVNGIALKSAKGLLPTKEEVAVTEKDANGTEHTITNVNALFEEPNANDGEGFVIGAPVVTDANGNTSDGVNAYVDASGQLMISGVKEGDYTITLNAVDYQGNPAGMTLKLSVVNMLKIYLMIGGGALLLIVLVVVIIMAISTAHKPKFVRTAILNMDLDIDGNVSNGSVMLQKYGKKPVKLSTLCSVGDMHMGPMRANLEKLTVSARKGGSILVSGNTKATGKVNMVLQSMDEKSIRFDQNGDRVITLYYQN